MAWRIDKILAVPVPTNPSIKVKQVDMVILEIVEKIAPFRVSYVNYKELKGKIGVRRFHLIEAMGERDK